MAGWLAVAFLIHASAACWVARRRGWAHGWLPPAPWGPGGPPSLPHACPTVKEKRLPAAIHCSTPGLCVLARPQVPEHRAHRLPLQPAEGAARRTSCKVALACSTFSLSLTAYMPRPRHLRTLISFTPLLP